ncbi:hypothetical protein PBI_PAT3_126 [Mycobacterium phage Pat3]|nr:hypothetical protein PBI_PAT3_126 [Mycobacterium phage Pat3]
MASSNNPLTMSASVDITPEIDWNALHGELTRFLVREVRHAVCSLLRRPCPDCK